MAVRDIIKLGDEKLVRPSAQVAFDDPELGALIQDMHDTMQAYEGVGIAAPQIGINKRVILFGGNKDNPRYPDKPAVDYTVLLNPELKAVSLLKINDWEGCISLPGLRGLVPRYQKIRYWGWNLKGEQVDDIAEDFHARVIQHEVDHVNGIIYPMRMKDLTNFGFEDVLWEKMTGEPYQTYLDRQKAGNKT